MKIITDQINLTPFHSRIFDLYFGGKKLAVFDIETTGLSPANCKVILSGILLADMQSGACKIIQYFADRPDDEAEIIRKTEEVLSSADYLLTYNGKHFDMPFMEMRAKKHGLSFDAPYNLDLYLLLSGHSPLRKMLPNLKQKSVEAFMGLSAGRDDLISGKESVALYERYMASKSFALEQQILLHNHDDLIQLFRLLPVISKTDLHGGLYKHGFLAGSFTVEKIAFSGRTLRVSALQRENPCDYISFPTAEKPYSLTMDSRDRSCTMTLPLSCEAGALYLDARAILGDKLCEIEKYPSVVNGYLIASDSGTINHMEINHFLKLFFSSLRFNQ